MQAQKERVAPKLAEDELRQRELATFWVPAYPFCGSGQINVVTIAYSYDKAGNLFAFACPNGVAQLRILRVATVPSRNLRFWITSGLLIILGMNDFVLECVAFRAEVRVLGEEF